MTMPSNRSYVPGARRRPVLQAGALVALLATLMSLAVAGVAGPAQAADGGAASAWGQDDFGQATVPSEAHSGVVQVAAGSGHSLALKSDGSAVAWGNNDYGQATIPAEAQSDVIQVAAGDSFSLALKVDGSVVAWGNDNYRQTVVPLAAQSGVAQVDGGGTFAVALKTDGTVVAWGDFYYGQTAVPGPAESDVAQVSTGAFHSLALKTDGSVVAWGDDSAGQSTVPTGARSGVTQVAAGSDHSLALRADGSVVAWGGNDAGQAAVPEEAESGVTQVAAGYRTSLAVKTDGSVVAWGTNDSGQTTVPADLTDVAQVAAGTFHSLALVGRANVGFSATDLTVSENDGTLDLTVTRGGNTAIPATVRYARTSGSATPGQDFTLPAGTLTFGPGETSRTIPLIITNDAAAERSETVVVALAPGAGTALGSPSSMTVTIDPSDQRPDALVSTAATTGYIGNNIYNTTGANQTETLTTRRAQTRTFYVRIANDGTVTNTFELHGSVPVAGSSVRYFSGTNEITTAMRSDSGWPVTLARGTSRTMKMQIRVLTTATIGSLKPGTVTAAWTGDGTRRDLVRGVVKVVR